jgi:hypothetical protein
MQAWPTCGDGAVNTLVGCEGRIILITDPALAVGALIAITLKALCCSCPVAIPNSPAPKRYLANVN